MPPYPSRVTARRIGFEAIDDQEGLAQDLGVPAKRDVSDHFSTDEELRTVDSSALERGRRIHQDSDRGGLPRIRTWDSTAPVSAERASWVRTMQFPTLTGARFLFGERRRSRPGHSSEQLISEIASIAASFLLAGLLCQRLADRAGQTYRL